MVKSLTLAIGACMYKIKLKAMKTKLTPKGIKTIKNEFPNNFCWYRLEQVDDITMEQITLEHLLTSTVNHRKVAIWYNIEGGCYNIAVVTKNKQ